MNFHILLTLSAVLLASSSANSLVKRDDDGDYDIICKQEPIELGIVLDSSSSIFNTDFQTGKEFLQDFVGQYQIGAGREGVRVSIITYGNGTYPDDGFNLDTYDNKEAVVSAIGRIPHRAGLYTDTGKAIKYMAEEQLSPEKVRPYAEKIGIVITDGNSQEWNYTKVMAKKARDAGIVMFAVGVGRGVRERELKNIAGNDSRVTKVDNYDKLSTILETLARKTCIKKLRPTTPPPMTQTCGEVDPADIYFVFSPADLGSDATSWTTSFISRVVDAEDMDNGFQYGVVSGSCPGDAGFDLDRYDNVTEIKTRLQRYTQNRVARLIQRTATTGYTAEHGGRAEAKKVAVVVASRGKGKKGLELEVSALVEQGIEVFIADPSGRGVEVEGAVTLSGRSSRAQAEAFVNNLCPE